MKRAIIFSFSRRGGKKACEIAGILKSEYEVSLYAPEKYAEEEIKPLPDKLGVFTGKIFHEAEALIYVSACGIAIRTIAPYIKSKTSDPAVICVDESGKFCVALLSGHIGGCNRLTGKIAKEIGAIPVITTATDVNGLFAADQWAAEQGFVVGDMKIAKEVAAVILETEVGICADKSLPKSLPSGLCGNNRVASTHGIAVSIYTRDPFDVTLHIIPRVLTLGIGCRRGTTKETIQQAVQAVLDEQNIDFRAVKAVASIDLKADEKGLLEFCDEWHFPITFYTPEQLRQAAGDFAASDFVRNVTGVDNVCERSAAASGGKILIKKTICNGVTVAVSENEWEVRFE